MSWSEIIGQPRAVEALKRTVASDRVAHAYLFYGPDGVGKRAVALEFARTLLCEGRGDEACEKCLSCNKVNRMIHPDVHVMFPHPKDADTHDIAERLKLLVEDKYATIDYIRRPSLADPEATSNKQAFYSVSRIHEEIRRAMSFKPVEGRYKIAILTDAHLLRTEASNAFLKRLEEPTPQTVFILTTARPDRLLPTILSRCQRIRFDPLSSDSIEAALIERKGLERSRAATLARMGAGSFSRAIELAENEELMSMRQLVLEFFRLAFSQNVDKLSDKIDQIGRMGREQVKNALGLMLRWLRDLLLFQQIGSEAILVNVDQTETINRFCANLPDADLEAMVKLVESAIELVERNANINLVLIVLAQKLGRAMRGPHSGKLYVPLAEDPIFAVG